MSIMQSDPIYNDRAPASFSSLGCLNTSITSWMHHEISDYLEFDDISQVIRAAYAVDRLGTPIAAELTQQRPRLRGPAPHTRIPRTPNKGGLGRGLKQDTTSHPLGVQFNDLAASGGPPIGTFASRASLRRD